MTSRRSSSHSGSSSSQESRTEKSPLKRPVISLDVDDKSEETTTKKTKSEAGSALTVSSPSDNKGLKIKLNTPSTKKSEPEVLKKASVFGDSSDDDEPEEMPPEAKMRMKNIGRDTQTSAGPNSFGKTRQGFCDTSKMFERQLNKSLNGKK